MKFDLGAFWRQHAGNGAQLAAPRPGLWPVMPSAEVMRGARDRFFVLALCLLAFTVQLYHLDERSLWMDEGFTARRISLPLGEIATNRLPIDNVVTQDTHPALYFLLLKLFSEFAGTTDVFVLKFFSVGWSVITVALLYTAGRQLITLRAGRVAALFGALSPLYLWYAQEMRMYTQLVALSLLAVYLLAWAGRFGHWARWILAGLATMALLYTQYSGGLVAGYLVLALMVITWVVGRARRFIALMAALLSTVPLVVWNFQRVLQGPETHFYFVPLDTIARDLLNGFSLGISVHVDSVLWLDALFLAILIVGVVVPFKDRRYSAWTGARWLLLGYLVLPVLAYYGFTFIKPAYQGVRHLILVSPAFYLLLARGFCVLVERNRAVALAILLVCVGGMGYSIDQYFHNPRYLKDDWQTLTHYIEAHAWPRDVIVVNNTFLRPVLDYYNQGDGLTWVTAPELPVDLRDPAQVVTQTQVLEALRAQHPRIWFVEGVPPDGRDGSPEKPDKPGMVQSWLTQNLSRVDRVEFEGRDVTVRLELYTSEPLVQDQPPEVLGSVKRVVWSEGPELRAYRLRLPAREVVGGQLVPLQFIWYASESLGDAGAYYVHIALLDESGLTWASEDAPAAPFKRGGTEWPIGKWILQGYTLSLPPGLPPGRYMLNVTLLAKHGDVLDRLPLPDGTFDATLERLTVAPTTSLPDLRRMAPGFVSEEIRFDNGVELIGYRVPAVTLRPGQPIAVQLFWRASRNAPEEATVTLGLVDWFGRTLTAAEGALSFNIYSVANWRQGQIVMTTAALRVPGKIANGSYRFQVGLKDGNGPLLAYTELWPFGRDAVELGLARIEGWPVVAEVPADVIQSGAVFDGRAALAGYRIEGEARPGAALRVIYYWRVLADMPAEVEATVVYAHLVGASVAEGGPGADVIAGLHDGLPADTLRPVDTWRAGEIVVDTHVIHLAPDLAPGRYVLYVGLYEGESGVRWPVTLAGVRQANDELRLPLLVDVRP